MGGVAVAFRRHRTRRLELRALGGEHLAGVYAVYGDPGTWAHLPEGRHTDAGTTAGMIGRAEASWRDHGLGYWALALAEEIPGCPVRAGEIIGTGGVSHAAGDVWNLGYRLTPAAWGHGLAGEVAAEALVCAAAVAPARPVVARLLVENTASRRVAERAGLTLLREDLEPSGPAAGRRRLTFTDRPVPTGRI
ncbi:GNAT family N-acetyltransferase [Streptomyces sp. NPDC004031]